MLVRPEFSEGGVVVEHLLCREQHNTEQIGGIAAASVDG